MPACSAWRGTERSQTCPSGTFRSGVLAGKDRQVYVLQQIAHDLNPRTLWVDAAVTRLGVKSGTCHFTGPATDAIVGIDGDMLAELFDLGHDARPRRKIGISSFELGPLVVDHLEQDSVHLLRVHKGELAVPE